MTAVSASESFVFIFSKSLISTIEQRFKQLFEQSTCTFQREGEFTKPKEIFTASILSWFKNSDS